MKTNDLRELAARITAPMRTTVGRAFLEIVPPTLDLLARGKPASPEEIAAASRRKSPEEVQAALDRFPSTEWDEQGRVVGAGLTLCLTPHRLELKGRTLFAWCALDALLFPVLLGRPASIKSPCRGTGDPVHTEVTPAGIEMVEPPSAVVSIVAARDLANFRSVGCNNTHFFSPLGSGVPMAREAPTGDHPACRGRVSAGAARRRRHLGYLSVGGADGCRM